MKTIIITCLSFLLAAGLTTSGSAKTSSPSTLNSVLEHYANIQSALARDTMENVSANAKTLAAEVRAAAQLEKGEAPGVFNGTIQPSGQGEWHASVGYENRQGKNSVAFTTSVGP